MVLVDTPPVTVESEPGARRVAITWAPGFPSSRERRLLSAAMALSLRAERTTRWLRDHRALRIIGPEDLEWIVETWLPAWTSSTRRGCTLALVCPDAFFGRRSTARFAELLATRGPDLRVSPFDDRTEAERWLAGLIPTNATQGAA